MYQHNWKKFPQLAERCQICARLRTPENEKLECMKPEPPVSVEFMRSLETNHEYR